MTEDLSFSERFELGIVRGALVFDDAPLPFRQAVLAALKADISVGINAGALIQRLSAMAVDGLPFLEERKLIENCEWWSVFEIAEAGFDVMSRSRIGKEDAFESAINEACRANRLGWRMAFGRFVVTASDAQSGAVEQAVSALTSAGMLTSAEELRQAQADLARLPTPDVTGAVQHAGAAIECLARELSGQHSKTLGAIIADNPALFPGALKKLTEGVWVFSSQMGRHLAEGKTPTISEALLLIGVVASLAAYLLDGSQPA